MSDVIFSSDLFLTEENNVFLQGEDLTNRNFNCEACLFILIGILEVSRGLDKFLILRFPGYKMSNPLCHILLWGLDNSTFLSAFCMPDNRLRVSLP